MTAYRSGCAAVLCITSMKCRFAWHRMKALVRKRHGCWRPSNMRRGITQHFCGRPFDWISYALSTSKDALGYFYALAAFSIAWISIWLRMTLHKSCTTGLKATSGASTFFLLSHRMIWRSQSNAQTYSIFNYTTGSAGSKSATALGLFCFSWCSRLENHILTGAGFSKSVISPVFWSI